MQAYFFRYNHQKAGEKYGEIKNFRNFRISESYKILVIQQLDLSYQNFNRMVNNETSSIRFENLDKLSTILNCPVGDLFEKVEDPIDD